MVLYFTGTGNSRFVAKRIAAAIGDNKVVDTAAFIREGKKGAFDEPGVYVFVSPIYVSAPPAVFMDFIRDSSFPSDCRAYFIMTCAGGMGGAPGFCRALAAEKGFTYMGTAEVEMPQNYIAIFKTTSAEESRKKIEAALPLVDELSALIRGCRSLPDPGMKSWELVSTKMILAPYYKHFMSAKPFAATDKCIGCGKCARQCPLQNISIVNKKPVWGEKCTHCMACINLCPTDAIEYGKKTEGKPRYKGPETVLGAGKAV